MLKFFFFCDKLHHPVARVEDEVQTVDLEFFRIYEGA